MSRLRFNARADLRSVWNHWRCMLVVLVFLSGPRPTDIKALHAAAPGVSVSPDESRVRPNILIVLVDDLGYSDLGCYGSEIETPNLDRLANQGLRFSQFYNTAKCHSSRIALLTGRHAYQAGQESLQHATTIAEMLSVSQYTTMMVGKWHLSKEPTEFGFERFFGHLSGACNYFRGDTTFRLDGNSWEVPENGFYTTVANVDYAIDFLDDARMAAEKPWFLYLAFNAPHAPLQPLEEDYRKYEGKYDLGWDEIRQRRFEKQLKLGLFPPNTRASARPDSIPQWQSLSLERRQWEAKRMAALAGMIDRVDREVGRLVENLREHNELENTLILFVSDNGACPYDRTSFGMNRPPYDPDSRWSDSTGWAWARNTPFRMYKQNQFEGGIATPGIVYWPSGLRVRQGTIDETPLHLVDVLPTIAEVTGAELLTEWKGRELRDISGHSFAGVLRGEAPSERPPLYFLFSADRGLREGRWKIVSFRGGPWELYDLETDRTERVNLAGREPSRVAQMVQRWERIARHQDHAPEKALKPGRDRGDSWTAHHPEWTAFEKPLGAVGKREESKARSAKSPARSSE